MRPLTPALLCLLLSTLTTAGPKLSQVYKLFEVAISSISNRGTKFKTLCEAISNSKLSKSSEELEKKISCSDFFDTYQFLGFHGTAATNIDSIQDGITVFDTRNPNNNENLNPVNGWRHGPAFYVTDSIMSARLFANQAVEQCKDKSPQNPDCAQALCGIFITKESWSNIPKVYFRPHINMNGRTKYVWYQVGRTNRAIKMYMKRKATQKMPLVFSPAFYKEGEHMQMAVPPEHTDNLVAFCTHDSLGSQLSGTYTYRNIPPIDLRQESIESAGRLFALILKEC
ncbi:hypothetical protein BKA69DRAFT_1129772 [Paraphysoderma sedebokerense]|nr:hypothetical protein BKA69DRAFT_1129772 [Paraphysoderma sedebokerense]